MEVNMVRKSLLALAAGAVLLGGCAYDGTYYDPAYAYNDGYYYYDRPTYRYYGPAYYPRYYTPAPSISLGYSYHRHR
jgi:hypothetical protein